MTTDVRHRATQRAGLRGVGFEFVLFALYVVVASALVRTPGGLGLAVVVAGVAVPVRVGLFSGPQLRGVLVTGCNVRSARVALPLVDVVGIEVMDRRELRRRVNADAVDLEPVPPGPTEAVVISMATPEGHRYAFGAAVDDAEGLARRVSIDERGIRSRSLELSWSEIEHVRLAPIDEVRMVPHARNTSAIWPPSWVLLVVRRSPTDASLRARTVLVGVPEPVDVGTVLDGTDAR